MALGVMALGVMALGVVGCGPSSWSGFREQLAQRSCDRAIRCGVLGGSERLSCPAPPELAVLAPGALDVSGEIERGRMRFSSGGAQDCLDAVAGAPCDPRALAARLNLRCHHIYGPNVEAGGECHGDGECVGGTCAGTACPRACVGFPPPGSACAPGGCDPTVQYCGEAADAGPVCLRHRQEGDQCSGGGECAYGLLCIAAKCSTPPRGGQPGDVCDDATATCAEKLYCDAGTRHCQPLAGAAAACAQPNACADGLVCVGSGGAPGTCKAWLDVGQPCVPGAGAATGCPASQRCDGASSTCALLAADGAGERQSCAGGACAPGLECDATQSCAFASLIGGSCRPPAVCATGLACEPMTERCVGTGGACAP